MLLKKISLIVFILTGSVFAADPQYFFYVNSPEEVDSYANIFNAIAKIFGSNDYLDLLKLVFLFGGFLTFAKAFIDHADSSSPGGIVKNYTSYIIVVTSILLIIFAQTATVVIKTNDIPSYCSSHVSSTTGTAVDNVPEIVAYTFNFMNKLGTEFTTLSETAFNVPSDQYGSYLMSDNEGYLGALKNAMIIMGADTSKKLSNGSAITNYDLPKAISTIFTQCILVPFSAKGSTGLDKISELKSTNNIYAYLDDLYTNNPDIGGIKARDYQATYGGETWKCGELWDNVVKPNVLDYKNNADCLYPEVNKGALQLITGQANPPKSTFHETILQSALISELEKSKSVLGVGVSGVKYSIGKSKAEFIQTKLAEGAYTAQMLPYIQSTLRSLLYAMFPFVFVIILFPGGLKVITEYLKSLIWIEMWTPTAAILNMFIAQHAQDRLGKTFQADNGLTLMNSVDMLTNGSAIAGTAGYLYASVPALTWLFLTGSEAMLSNFGAGMSSFMLKNIRTEEFLKDTKEISKNQEVRNQTGEDIAIAEMQHYEAVQQGTLEGTKLGTQMELGLDNVKENEAYKTSKDVKSFLAMKEATDSVSGDSLATTEATAKAVDSAGHLKAVRDTVQADDGSFSLNETGKINVEQDEFASNAEMIAKEQHQLDQEQFDLTELSERQAYQTEGETLSSREQHDMANGIVMTDSNGNPDHSKYINRFARTDGMIEAHEKEVDQITAQNLGMIGKNINVDGTPTMNYNRAAQLSRGEANTEAYNIQRDITETYRKQADGLDPNTEGTARAYDTEYRVGKTNTRTKLANQMGYSNYELGAVENQTYDIGTDKTTYSSSGEVIYTVFTNKGSKHGIGFEWDQATGDKKLIGHMQYLRSIMRDLSMLTGLLGKPIKMSKKMKKKLKKMEKELRKKTTKHLKEKMNYKKMTKAQKQSFHKMLKDARALGMSEKELMRAMSLKELEDQVTKAKIEKKKKLTVKISEKANKFKAGLKRAPGTMVKAATHAPAYIVTKTAKGGSKFMVKLAKGSTKGLVGIASVFAAEGLEATGTKAGHFGAEGIRAVDDIAWGGIKGLFHGGMSIGYVLKGDFESAGVALDMAADDIVEAYDKTKQHLGEMYDTGKAMIEDTYNYVSSGEIVNDLHKAEHYFTSGEFKQDVDKAVDYVTSGELKKDVDHAIDTVKDVSETVANELEKTYDETVNYYKTHSVKEIWNDITSFF